MRSKQFYEKHSGLFKYYDYNYERYQVSFSIALIKLNDELTKYDIDFNAISRYSDKYLQIDMQYHFFLFLGTDVKKAFQSVLNLEKNLITKYNLYHINNIFQSAIVSKEKYESIEEMIRMCFELINECKENQAIITEDDL